MAIMFIIFFLRKKKKEKRKQRKRDVGRRKKKNNRIFCRKCCPGPSNPFALLMPGQNPRFAFCTLVQAWLVMVSQGGMGTQHLACRIQVQSLAKLVCDQVHFWPQAWVENTGCRWSLPEWPAATGPPCGSLSTAGVLPSGLPESAARLLSSTCIHVLSLWFCWLRLCRPWEVVFGFIY